MLMAGGCAVLLAGCMHHGTQPLVSSGDVAIDSLTATRTALLRVDNAYPAGVRVYTVLGGQENYIAKLMPAEVKTFVLDPNIFPTDKISFDIRPVDGSAARRLGPFRVVKGQTVDMVVPQNLDYARVNIHRSN
jgi:hypothetical protein